MNDLYQSLSNNYKFNKIKQIKVAFKDFYIRLVIN